jgi:NAD(P)-dependent dehydrogenase (short-subunit alcohol dehydrogenase family)
MHQDSRLRTFDGAVALITGGASGIGRALGAALARRGAAVILADLQVELAEEAAAAIRARGGRATAAPLDVRDFAAVDHLVRQTAERHGRLDYLFNNAGTSVMGEVRLHDITDWDRVFAVNLRGVVNGVQAAYPLMLRQRFGHIVNTASAAGLLPVPTAVSYCASKHAVVGLSTALRIEAAAGGVRVSVLCPGTVQTPILEGGGKFGKVLQAMPPEVMKRHWERMRPMPAERFASAALRAIAHNQAVIIIPFKWRLFCWLNRLAPALGFFVMKQGFALWQRACDLPLLGQHAAGGRPAEADNRRY